MLYYRRTSLRVDTGESAHRCKMDHVLQGCCRSDVGVRGLFAADVQDFLICSRSSRVFRREIWGFDHG